MSTIADKPRETQFRSAVGLSAAAPAEGRVNPTGGKWGAGLIRGVSVLTRGEALGHGFWVDTVMLDQCLSFMQAMNDKGLKSRFTHPGLCADGLAKKLGILVDGKRVGDQVLADEHFNGYAHKSPDGDLAGYVMARAEEEPEHFGTSIVFISDDQAEIDFMLANGGRWETVEDEGGEFETIVDFKSPDPDNVESLPHARIKELLGCDVVDDPAANPHGFFHRDLSAVKDGESFLDYALGLSEVRPATVSFGVDPDRARQFLTQWATSRGLSLPLKGDSMLFKRKKLAADPADPAKTPPSEPPKPDEKAVDIAPVVPDADGKVTCPKCGEVFPVAMEDGEEADPISDEPQSPSDYAAAHAKYTHAFGAEAGTKFFLGKVKFSAAQKQHFETQLAAKDKVITDLQTQLKSANDRLAFFGDDGTKPFNGSPAPKGTEGNASVGGFVSLFKAASGNPGSN
ncbi:MAG TPA: hypothetical protein VGM98_09490 [Schlesneria sp.]|jgi:hypothetical protein